MAEERFTMEMKKSTPWNRVNVKRRKQMAKYNVMFDISKSGLLIVYSLRQ
jgi:hypothetical protein